MTDEQTIADTTTPATGNPSAESITRLREMLSGYQLAQALYVAAALGVADSLVDGPRAAAEIAAVTGAHAPSLRRILRALAAAGVFIETEDGQFALVPLGAGLRAGVPGSLRHLALMYGEHANWAAWGNLLHTVRTGETSWDYTHGMGVFDYYTRHPESGTNFNATMTTLAEQVAGAVAGAHAFAGCELAVDVGGGQGTLISAVLQTYPFLGGILFDLPEVVAGASPALERAGVADRCDVVAGDFFVSVPPGGDVYLLQRIILDWEDAQAVAILRNCRAAMRPGGRVLIIEALMPDHTRAGASMPRVFGIDLQMMVHTGGRVRQAGEFRELFDQAGLALRRIVPAGPLHIVEGVA